LSSGGSSNCRRTLDVLGPADEADGLRIAGVGEFFQGVAQGAQLGALQGAAGAGGVAIGNGGLVGGRQQTGAGEQSEGVFFQGPNPEVLGFSGVLVEVAAVSLEAFGKAQGEPVGGFVEGAGVFFGIWKFSARSGL
jgi:hypothetical protein